VRTQTKAKKSNIFKIPTFVPWVVSIKQTRITLIFTLLKYRKRSTRLIFLLIISALVSCQEDSKTFDLGVDIQSFFDQDDVQVFIDDKQVIHEELKTDPVFIVCSSVRLQKNEGNHTIRVVVNDTSAKTEVFQLKNDLFIGVNYDPISKEVSFIYASHPFGYR